MTTKLLANYEGCLCEFNATGGRLEKLEKPIKIAGIKADFAVVESKTGQHAILFDSEYAVIEFASDGEQKWPVITTEK